MTEENKKSLEAAAVDVIGAMERFIGNEDLYGKFLLKFLQDNNYEELLKAVANQDARAAYRCAHTLKGVSANLGLQGLLDSLQPLMKIFRSGSLENTNVLIERLKSAYESTCAAINQL